MTVAAISTDPVVQTHILTHPAFQPTDSSLKNLKTQQSPCMSSQAEPQNLRIPSPFNGQDWTAYVAQTETKARRVYLSTRNRLFSRAYRDRVKLEAIVADDVAEEKRLERLFGTQLNKDARTVARGNMLNELKRALNRDANLLIREIEELWRLYQSMRVSWILKDCSGSARLAVEELAEMQIRLEMRGIIEFMRLENRLDFVEKKIFADGWQGASELKTRIIRLTARDVEPERRNEERERRLENSDAIEYSLWLREDLNFLRAWQASIVTTLCAIEEDIESVAVAWMDIRTVCETAWLTLSAQEGRN